MCWRTVIALGLVVGPPLFAQIASRSASPPLVASVAIRAPLGCSGGASCGDDLTLAEARRAYEEAGPDFIPRSLTDYHACNTPETRGEYYGWAPIDRLPDGRAALARLAQRARGGQPFASERSPYRRYVVVESDQSNAEEQHLALCYVTQVEGMLGPPRQCATVAVLTGQETWLRTGDPTVTGCLQGTSLKNSGAIEIHFDVLTKAGLAPLSASLLKLLQSDLKLAATERPSRDDRGVLQSVYIRTAGALRLSNTLASGWREAVDFDVTLQAGASKVSIYGVAHVQVARQASGSLTEYKGMDDVQKASYAAFLDAKVNAAIKAACPGYVQRDASTVQCDAAASPAAVLP